MTYEVHVSFGGDIMVKNAFETPEESSKPGAEGMEKMDGKDNQGKEGKEG